MRNRRTVQVSTKVNTRIEGAGVRAAYSCVRKWVTKADRYHLKLVTFSINILVSRLNTNKWVSNYWGPTSTSEVDFMSMPFQSAFKHFDSILYFCRLETKMVQQLFFDLYSREKGQRKMLIRIISQLNYRTRKLFRLIFIFIV